MRLKSYFAATVEAAMRSARQELSEDAMLMNSRPSSPEARHLGAYEVVFAVDGESQPDRDIAAGAGVQAEPMAQRLAAEVEQMRRQLSRVSSALLRPQNSSGRWFSHRAIEELYSELTQAELDPDLAYEAVAKIDHPAAEGNLEQTRAAIREELKKRFSVAPPWATASRDRRVVALVGPPAVGKTTTLIKLAARYGLTTRRPTQILSVDTYRIGAADQLRTYAAILGVGFEALETPAALAQSLEEHSRKELVLIDTPGYSEADFGISADFASFFASRTDIETHLVLSSAAKSSDLTRVVDRYDAFHFSRLLFTRLDETTACGAIVNEAVRTQIPLSFLSSGQSIPDDLEPATLDGVLERMLDGGWLHTKPPGWGDPDSKEHRIGRPAGAG